jgi:outer membrane receptor protein involved in Fe transport
MRISTMLGAVGAAVIAGGVAHAEEDLRPDAGEIVVTGARVPDAVDGALGASTRLRDVPQGVSVVPDYVIELQQPLSLTDIARNTPSISNFRNSSETFRTVSICGFVQYETTMVVS